MSNPTLIEQVGDFPATISNFRAPQIQGSIYRLTGSVTTTMDLGGRLAVRFGGTVPVMQYVFALVQADGTFNIEVDILQQPGAGTITAVVIVLPYDFVLPGDPVSDTALVAV